MALQQIQDFLQQRPETAAQNMGPIKDKLSKIYDAAEGFQNKNNSHADQMRIWIDKIKVIMRQK